MAVHVLRGLNTTKYTGFQWSGEAYLTDLKLRYVESTPLEEERRVDIKESPARILIIQSDVLSSSWRFSNEKRSGGSVTKGGVKKNEAIMYKVPHVFTLIDRVYAIGF